MIKNTLKRKPKERLKLADIKKHKWFKKHGYSFVSEEVKKEVVDADLRDILLGGNADPFAQKAKPEDDSLLEREIALELKQIEAVKLERERLKRLNLTQSDGNPDLADETSGTRVSKRKLSQSMDDLPADHVRVIYRNQVTNVSKKDLSSDLIQKLTSSRKEGTLKQTFNAPNKMGESVDDGFFMKRGLSSQEIIDDIENNYENFDKCHHDAGAQVNFILVLSNLPRKNFTTMIPGKLKYWST